MNAGVAGLLRDKTRPSRIPPLARDKVEEVIALTLKPPWWTLSNTLNLRQGSDTGRLHFNQERSLYSRQNFKTNRAAALAEWCQLFAA